MRISDQEANRLHILRAIRRAEPVARTELVKLTGLSSATVSDITGELLDRGFLLEAKAPAVGRGRPRMQLLLNPDAAYVAGAFLHSNSVVGVEISNARGDSLFKRAVAFEHAPTVPALAERLAEIIETVIAESPVPKARISSLGLALPGAVDNVQGVLHWLHGYPKTPVAFADIVERRLQLPVSVDNTVNVMARAEHWFGEDRQVDDFSLFTVDLGLGFSQYVDGLLRVGAHGMNAELPHVKLGLDDGPTCLCGAKGCLLTVASMYGVVLRVHERRGWPRPKLGDLVEACDGFAREAHAGDAIAREAFDRAGRLLGVAVANHINMSDPSRVIVLALNAPFADLIVAPFYAALQESVFAPLRGRTAVQFKVAEEIRYSHGAAALVLEQLYRTPQGYRT